MTTPKQSEASIQRSILDYLAYRNVFAWRQNSGAAMIQTKTGFRPIFFGAVGAPDVFAIKDGVIYGLEVKSATGKQNENQKTFQQGFEKAGGKYFVVRSIEEVQKINL